MNKTKLIEKHTNDKHNFRNQIHNELNLSFEDTQQKYNIILSNINNYNLGINNIDCDNYEIVLGSDLDIYKVNINDIELVGILREYPSIIKKFISKKLMKNAHYHLSLN